MEREDIEIGVRRVVGKRNYNKGCQGKGQDYKSEICV